MRNADNNIDASVLKEVIDKIGGKVLDRITPSPWEKSWAILYHTQLLKMLNNIKKISHEIY